MLARISMYSLGSVERSLDLLAVPFADQTFSDDDIRYMLRQFSDKATVDFVSFATSLHEKIGDSRYHEAFGDAFDLFDTGMRGELSADDLIDGMAKLGENLTSAEAEDMIKLAAKVRQHMRCGVADWVLQGCDPVPTRRKMTL
jgi:Ca2+-binding EF-hand superfamily protein